MKRRNDQEELLNDVLTDESSVSAAASLDQLLRLARQRQRRRQAQRAGGILVVIAAVVFVLVPQLGTQKTKPELAHEPVVSPSYETVSSFSLTSEQVVSSRPLAPEQLVHSESLVMVTQTTATDVPRVNDEELLELARPNVVALVRRGPQETELVFVEPAAAHN
jgi:hypothetical protein